MVWQSFAGGFCTEAAHSPLSWARSASPTPLAFRRAEKQVPNSWMAPLDAQGEPRESNQPQNSFMRIFFLGWELKLGEALWDGAARTSCIHHQLHFFSLEEGAAVNLFLCLCSINRIREKAWKQWDKVPLHMVMYTEMED